jgi:hypothetical protein
MANAHSVMAQRGGRTPRSLLGLTVLALVLALGFDALSTALVWDVVRALPGTVKRAPVRAVRSSDVRESRRLDTADQASSNAPAP